METVALLTVLIKRSPVKENALAKMYAHFVQQFMLQSVERIEIRMAMHAGLTVLERSPCVVESVHAIHAIVMKMTIQFVGLMA